MRAWKRRSASIPPSGSGCTTAGEPRQKCLARNVGVKGTVAIENRKSKIENPPAVDLASVRRVLIIKMSALGDIIHALPVSAALGEAFPYLELTWIVEEGFLPLVSGNPYLAHILTLPKVRGRQLRSLASH